MTIDPPPEHASHPLHWAFNVTNNEWLVFEVRNGKLWHTLGHTLNASALYDRGWWYRGPAMHPSPPEPSDNE